jgi:hypothetical protein
MMPGAAGIALAPDPVAATYSKLTVPFKTRA